MNADTKFESVYEPRQEGLIYPRKPVFPDIADERAHRKQRLAAACRFFGDKGFGYGFGGHLTVRDPEDPDLFWTNPMCIPFGQVRLSQLILVDPEGKVVEGEYAVNLAGYLLHSSIHAQNPDIIASCHAHTVHGGAWASMGRELDPISQDACMFYGDHVVVSEGAGKVSVYENSGDAIAEAFATNKAVIHQNHGLLTASRHSIDDSAWWFYNLDYVCRMQMLSDSLPYKPVQVPHESAAYTREHIGTPYFGWLQFQTEYADILKNHPDVFD